MHQDHKYIIFSTTALNFLNMLKIEITDYCMKNLAPEVASFSNGFYIYYYRDNLGRWRYDKITWKFRVATVSQLSNLSQIIALCPGLSC